MKKRLFAFLLVLAILVPCVVSAETWYRLKEQKRLWNLPDYNSRVLDTYRADWALTVSSSVDKTWAAITLSNGVSGYLEKKFFIRDKSYTAWVSSATTHLKHGPGSGFANEGTLSKGDSVKVLTHGKNWSYVSSSAGNGYVSNGDLSSRKVKASSSAAGGSSGKAVSYKAWVVSLGGPVGLRSAPSGSNDVVFEKHYPGTQITVLRECGEFNYVRINYNGNEGYMRSRYISKSRPAQADKIDPKYSSGVYVGTGSSSESSQSSPTFPFTLYAKASGGEKPKLFQGEGLGWAYVTIEPGTAVTVVGKATDIYWYKVTVNGRPGYMPDKFLSKTK